LVAKKSIAIVEGSVEHFSEAYYNDVNHKKDLVDALYYLLHNNYKVFECNINTKNESYEKGEEITKNNLFNSVSLSDYLKNIENKVNEIIKTQITKLDMQIERITECLEEDKALINNDNISEEEKISYKKQIEHDEILLIEYREKLNKLHKLDEENKKDLKTLIID
jgi:hypothetical protein